MIDAVPRALGMAFAMGWQILWPLVLGFALSAVVQAVVSHREMARLLPDDRPRSIATALALGAASSSCSYAAVALARSLFRKGADFTAARFIMTAPQEGQSRQLPSKRRQNAASLSLGTYDFGTGRFNMKHGSRESCSRPNEPDYAAAPVVRR
jgi:hypothetical protein